MIRFQLYADDVVVCLGEEVRGHAPALRMAKRLIDRGFPPGTKVEIIAATCALGDLVAPAGGAAVKQ